MIIQYFYKFGIDPVREDGVVFKFRADHFKLQALQIFHKDDSMRISHGNSRKCPVTAISKYWRLDGFFRICYYRDFGCSQFRCTHVHPYSLHFPVFYG